MGRDWNTLHKSPTGQINLFLFSRRPSEPLIQPPPLPLRLSEHAAAAATLLPDRSCLSASPLCPSPSLSLSLFLCWFLVFTYYPVMSDMGLGSDPFCRVFYVDL